MADLAKTTIASGNTLTSGLDALTEHGQVKIFTEGGNIRVEGEIDTDDWVVLYESSRPIIVVDYVGTKLRITNLSSTSLKVRVGQA